MFEQAITKLETEMKKNKDDAYIQVIGDFLRKYLETNPDAAEKIMADEKTIARSIDEMTNVARKKSKKNRAMLTDAEGYEIVLEYFGIKPGARVQTPAPAPAAPVPENKSMGFNVRLEDLL